MQSQIIYLLSCYNENMESDNEQQLKSNGMIGDSTQQPNEEHDLDNIPVSNGDSQKVTKEKNKKHKALKLAIIIVSAIIGVLFIGYIIMLISITGSLSRFGEPFWFENGRLFFGPSSCGGDDMRLHCSVTADPYSWCSCEKRTYVNGHEFFPVDKPMIYLYPESTLDLNVSLGSPELLTSSYPKYVDGWNIVAYPNGDLIDKNSGKKLYALYWEGQREANNLDMTTGFIVKGEESAEFLEEKLEVLGLNYREAEEFIVYWLPKLELHEYNYIYFATEEEIEAEMPLEFSVEPDTLIRVRMIFEGLDEYKEVKEQTLTPASERNGFTVVEWGGTDLTTRDD